MAASNHKSSTQDVMGANPDTQRDVRNGRGSRQPKDGDRLPNASVHLEPVSRRDYDLSYACLLIPRANDHFLNGKVASFLEGTIRQISNVFGWRLDFIQVQPEYLQWVVSAPAATPPSRCIHMIRQETSKGILGKFREFRVKDKNAKSPQDFWAPGYLVLVGSSPHPPEVIREFIRLTRLQQQLPPRAG